MCASRRSIIAVLTLLAAGGVARPLPAAEGCYLVQWQGEGADVVHHAVVDYRPQVVVIDGLEHGVRCDRRDPRPGVVVAGYGSQVVLRASVTASALKGEWLAPAWPDFAAGAIVTGEALGDPQARLDHARQLQLQRRPRPALLIHLHLLRRHLSERDLAAAALVHALEAARSLAGDPAVERIYTDQVQRAFPGAPALDMDEILVLARAKELVAAELRRRLEEPASDDGAVPASRGQRRGPGWDWDLRAGVSLGSLQRFDQALIRERPASEIIDAQISAGFHHRGEEGWLGRLDHHLRLRAGTDPVADEEWVPLAGLSLVQRSQTGHRWFDYALGVGAAYSDDREWIAEVDLAVSLLRAGFHRDRFGRSFRVGLGTGLVTDERGTSGVWLLVDRIIDYKPDQRQLATKTAIDARLTFDSGFFIRGGAHYLYAGRREDGGRDHDWELGLGCGWELGR